MSETVYECLVRTVEIAFEQYPVRLVVQGFFHQSFHAVVKFVRIAFTQYFFLFLQLLQKALNSLVTFDKGCGLNCQFVVFVLQLCFEHSIFQYLYLLLFCLPFSFSFFLFFLMQVFQIMEEYGVYKEPYDGDIAQPCP